MIVAGLTGSIGMGKSTTLAMFADAGVPVHSADEAVHKLYSGKAATLIDTAFPGVLVDGAVDRGKLGTIVLNNREALKRLEAIVHPLVRTEEEEFLKNARENRAPLAVIDIPLLFETGGESRVDKVIVVTAPPHVQRQRVMARPGMTAEKFEAIMARQMPDPEKRRRADYVIDTGEGLDAARNAVAGIVKALSVAGASLARKGGHDA